MRNAATPNDGNHNEMDELDCDLGDTDDAAVSVPGLAEAFREPTDETTAVTMASRAVAIQTSLAKGAVGVEGVDQTITAADGFGSRLRHMFGSVNSVIGRTSVKAAVGVAAALSLTGGLAAADVLPDPIQEPISDVAGVVGINLPTPDDDSEELLVVEADDEPNEPTEDNSALVDEESDQDAAGFDESSVEGEEFDDLDDEEFDDDDFDDDLEDENDDFDDDLEDENDDFDDDEFDGENDDENDELEERIEELEEQASELEEQAGELRVTAAGVDAEEAADLLANADALDRFAAGLRDEANLLAAAEGFSFSLNDDEDQNEDEDEFEDESDDDFDDSDEDDFDDSDDNDNENDDDDSDDFDDSDDDDENDDDSDD